MNTNVNHETICKQFYSALCKVIPKTRVKAFEGARVTGNYTAYSVELKDGTKIDVGAFHHCHYCVLSEAINNYRLK